MKYFIYFITLFIIFIFSQKSFCQSDRWEHITSGNEYEVYYDKETILYNGNEVIVFIKYIYSKDSKEFGNIKYSIDKDIFYCNKYKCKIISTTTYFRNGSTENFEFNFEAELTPDSIGEKIYNFFCK